MKVGALETRKHRAGATAGAALASVALVAAAFVAEASYRRLDLGWGLLAAALLLAIVWGRRVELDGCVPPGPVGPSSRRRRLAGAILALAGGALWWIGTTALLRDWTASFDRAWLAWIAGTFLLGAGLDLLWALWRLPPRPGRRRLLALVLALVAVGALFRLGTFYFFPAPYHVTQVEELQVGAMATEVLNGSRIRWEFLSQAWLGALGVAVGGPNLMATRLPSTFLSILKLVPMFLWLRFSVGNAGAIVGTALLAVSGWDSTFARVQTNHNVLVVATAFALLAGPARRGRPSAYVWLGLLSGYVMFEYVLYRPLALFALVGAGLVSWRDPQARWPARLARPLLTAALCLAMCAPLYGFLNASGRTREFFDGYGRARANVTYYNPADTWEATVERRLQRINLAAGLFFFRGPGSPVANPKSVPLADPFTGAMLLLGLGYGLAHPLRRLFGLTVAACLFTLVSALIVTGNFDYVRAGSAVGYLFALAGFGAAAFFEALRPLGRAWGRRAAAVLLAAGLVSAAAFSGRYLHFFVTSPEIRRAQFRDLAYLAWWLQNRVGPEDRVVIAAPNFPYLMDRHDAAWMRGERVQGASFWDLQSALRDWAQHPQATLVAVYAGPTWPAVQAYLSHLLPSAEFGREPEPGEDGKELLYHRSRAKPPELEQVLARWGCEPVTLSVDLFDADGELLSTLQGTAGLIDPTLWPGGVQETVRRLRPQVKRAEARFSATIRIEKGGLYVFPYESYPGAGRLSVDGTPVPYPPTSGVQLEPGLHHLELRSEYDPHAAAPMLRLFWQGPDSAGIKELVPFYRISPARPGCGGV